MNVKESDEVHRIAGDPDAFEAFYREHLAAVQRFVARRVIDPHLAADLTADVFVAAVDAASQYRTDRGSPAGWLAGIARNVVAAEYRRQARHRNVERRVSGRRLLDPNSLARIEERLDAERETRRAYEAIGALPRRYRAMLELIAVDGLSVTEAAAVLGVKPGTARVWLHRCRARIQSHLQPVAPAAAAALTQEVQS